jgi:two-component system OmpR family sensor kinase/two-component system sensor histidine kinase BaeS
MLQNWMDENGSNQPDKRMWNCRGTFFAENDSHQKDDWYQRHKSLHDNRPEKRRFLFIRFLSFFLPVLFVFIAIILTILKLFYDNFQEVFPDLRGFMPVVFAFPVVIGILFFILGGLAFRRLGSPLADVMAALDAVADGDLSVRVDENARGEFGRMARSFNRMAEELDNAEKNRRNLTADVAHELRTPLHIIQGNLEGMLDGVYEPTKEQIGAALEETRLLSRLVNDLQTLSLAEAGKLQLHCQPVLASDLIEDILTGFSVIAAENGITLQKEITGTDVELTVNADPDRMSQVLNNLVANAMRYTQQGGVIRLNAFPDDKNVTLIVEDTGSGIAPEDLPNVFERFWKAEKSRSRHEGTGSGLGLAIAKQLVQAHGGTIRAESELGRGTCFTICIPRGNCF